MTQLVQLKPKSFEPKIVGFLCNWCSYAGADKAGASQAAYPPNVSVIRVMCSGRVDPQFVLQAFRKGADGVLVLACHPGDCHYKEGNYRAVQRHRMLLRMIEQFGIEKERCLFDYVSAGEGEKFVRVITEMVGKVKALGPLPERTRLRSTPIHEHAEGEDGVNKALSRLTSVRPGQTSECEECQVTP